MASYWVTGVWKDDNKAISALYIHLTGQRLFKLSRFSRFLCQSRLCPAVVNAGFYQFFL